MRRITTLIVSLPLLIFAAEWHTLNGPPAGRADDMTMGYDTIIPAWVIYAADHSHKLYKSTNEGNSWYVPTDDEIVNNPVCVLTRSNDAKVVYIGKSAPIPVWW